MQNPESFLGIQFGNGEVIPVDIHSMDQQKVVFGLPDHNAKTPYFVAGDSSDKMDMDLVQSFLASFMIRYPDAKTKHAKSVNKQCGSLTCQRNMVGHRPLTLQRDRAPRQPSLDYEIVKLGPEMNASGSNFSMSSARLKRIADELFENACEIYRNNIGNRGMVHIALEMMRQAQVHYHALYPDLFAKMVLPAVCRNELLKIDKNAEMMNPSDFELYIEGQLSLSQLREAA